MKLQKRCSPLQLSKIALILGIFLIVFPFTGIQSQNQNNFWVYGYQAGINFNTDPPSYEGGFAIQASEGAASVADAVTGELLFYTDGLTVWNSNNNPMPNGSGLQGGVPGSLSSTTAAVICARPGNANQYYIITVDEQASVNGVRYSLVDMTLAGGLGDIVAGQKNIPIFSTNTEKACIVPNAAGTGYWLVTHNMDAFYAFAISASGISNTPVVSAVGGAYPNGAGFMKCSQQFDRISAANIFFQDAEIYDFDNATGILSNPLILNLTSSGAAGGAYGIEFSCSGELLYVTDGSNLFQFDLSLGNAASIVANAYTVLSNSFSCYGLQLGPDRKLYISNGALDVVNSPDLAGAACDYQQGAITGQLSGGGWGLPMWVYRTGDTPISCTPCEPVFTELSVSACESYILPDGTETSEAGEYSFTFQSALGCDSTVSLTLTLTEAPQFSVEQSIIGCGNQSLVEVTATGNGPFTFAIPAQQQINSTGSFTLPAGSYTLTVTDSEGCTTSETLAVAGSSTCPWDFNEDAVVGVTDLQLFNAAYGCTSDCCPYDLNSDGTVSVADLLSFIVEFGTICN